MTKMQREIGLIVLLLLFQTIFLPPHIILVHEFGFQSPQLPQKPIPQIIDTSVPHIEYTKQMRHAANSSWVPFVTSIPAGTPPDIRIIYSDMHKMVIRARFYGMWNWSTSPGGTAYNSIEIPFTGMLTRVSAPELPFVTRYVEIPYGVTVTSSILHEESNCTLLQSNYFILPHKGPWYPTNGTFPLIPTQDPAIYSMNAFWPALNFTDTGASVSDALVIRGRRILALNFVPITFNPQLRKLRAYNELLVQLAYDRPTSLQALNPQLESPVYTDLLNKFLLNPRTSNISNPIPMRATRSSLQSGIASKYLIITVEAFRDQVKRLKDWKDTKGIPTEIITVESLPDYPFDTEDEKRTAIYNAIHHAYHNRASAPDYVLLVGDSEHIPPYYKMDHTSIEYGNLPIGTDLFYFTVDGSGILPDILYGRLSANTPQQLRAMVDKILNYSKTPPLGVSFYSPVSAISTIIDDDEFNEIRIRLSEKLEDHVSVEYCNDATEINDSLNAGRFMAYYIGHGDSMNQNGYGEGWRHDAYLSYTTEEAATLDIHHFDFEYPVLFSMSCNTGWFDGETDKDSLFKIVSDHSYECFCENLTRMDQRGPVAMFGATRVSELSYNYILMQGFLDALYPDFDPTMPNAEGYTLGQLLYYGKLYMTHYYGITEPQTGDSLQNLNRTHMTLQMYHLFGDPEMSLATSMMPLYVSYETTMGIGSGQGFIVHVETGSETPIGGATVCLQKGSEVYAVDRTNIFGDVVFKFDDVTLTPGKMNVTVTKQGYAPHIGETEFYPFTGSISVDPRFGLGGSEVYLTIENFAPSETVQISWAGGPPESGPTTDENGYYSRWKLQVPTALSGWVPITAWAAPDSRATIEFQAYDVSGGNADPYLYCQNDSATWHRSHLGDSSEVNPIWSNPDIAVLRYPHEPSREFQVLATVHNWGPEAAVNTRVIFEYSAFGIGPTFWKEISEKFVRIDPSVPKPVLSECFVPDYPYICVRVRLEYDDDINPDNNFGLVNIFYEQIYEGPAHRANISIPVYQPNDLANLVLHDTTGTPLDPEMIAELLPPYVSGLDVVNISVYIGERVPDGTKRTFTIKYTVDGELIGGADILLEKFESPPPQPDPRWLLVIIAGIVIVGIIIILIYSAIKKRREKKKNQS